MKITLRMSEPVTEVQHQRLVLSTAIRDVGASLLFQTDGDSMDLPENPFKFNAEGTAVEGVIAGTIPDKNLWQFKQMVMDTMNAAFRGKTTKTFEPSADFPKVAVKTIDVQNEIQAAR